MTVIPDKIVYTAEATSTGGRVGRGKTADGKIDLVLDKPVEMGGKGEGANPEQLFAIGYSACFLGALKFVAGKENVTVPDDASITARVSFGPIPNGFGLQIELRASLPGVDHAVAEDLVQKAHIVCPYSNATRNNVEVTLTVV
jgi:Ohr subfamily peroxiredoxin